jgi:hypothetical protein
VTEVSVARYAPFVAFAGSVTGVPEVQVWPPSDEVSTIASHELGAVSWDAIAAM